MQGPVHAVLPFPDPRKPQPDLSASQALHPVPGTMLASRAASASLRSPRQASQAAAEEEQGDGAAELEDTSRGDFEAVLGCPHIPFEDPTCHLYNTEIRLSDFRLQIASRLQCIRCAPFCDVHLWSLGTPIWLTCCLQQPLHKHTCEPHVRIETGTFSLTIMSQTVAMSVTCSSGCDVYLTPDSIVILSVICSSKFDNA